MPSSGPPIRADAASPEMQEAVTPAITYSQFEAIAHNKQSANSPSRPESLHYVQSSPLSMVCPIPLDCYVGPTKTSYSARNSADAWCLARSTHPLSQLVTSPQLQ